MKKLLTFAAAILFTSTVFAQLPSTTIKEMTGKPVKFNSIFEEGKVTVVSFWATWCVPCKAEIRNIRDNLEEWQEETDFDFVTISIDDSRAASMVKAYTRSQGWDWPNYQDPNSDLKRSLNFQNVPFTIIVDQDGKIVYQHTGYEEGAENGLYSRVQELVNGSVAEEAIETAEEAIETAEEAVEAVEDAAEAVVEEVDAITEDVVEEAPSPQIQEGNMQAPNKVKRASRKARKDK